MSNQEQKETIPEEFTEWLEGKIEETYEYADNSLTNVSIGRQRQSFRMIGKK